MTEDSFFEAAGIHFRLQFFLGVCQQLFDSDPEEARKWLARAVDEAHDLFPYFGVGLEPNN